MMPIPQFQPVQTEYFPLRGGLNLVTPALSIPPGMVVDAMNYEPEVSGGYRRINGFERTDGRPAPSDASYWLIGANITGTIAAGDTVTGATSAATGVVLQVNDAELVLTKVSGTFVSGENLQVSAVTQAVSTSAANEDAALTVALHATYANLAADEYRDDIQKPTGSGSILGGFLYGDTNYCFRANAGGTAVVLYKSTASGWSAISFGEEVSFSNANTSVGDGDTLTQGGVTATIARVVVETGTLASGTNTGRLILTGRAGGNYAAGAASSTGGGSLTLSGAQSAITLATGGRFETVTHNFTGSTATKRVYGCDGVNRGWEFDPTNDLFVPISTGMSTDTPKFVAVHKNRLFFSFRGSLQFSSVGLPYMWTALTGAAEIGVGDEITGFLSLPGDNATSALAVYSRNSTHILYGSTSTDFQMVAFAPEAGAVAYTAKWIGGGFALDDRGVVSLSATQAFGNFVSATISQIIQPRIDAKRGLAVAATISRSRNQYRVYFTDGTGLIFGFDGRKLLGIMPFDYGKAVTCIWSGEKSDGTEAIYFGASDGYVYQADKGTSFDGSAIEAWFRLPFNHLKSPRIRKRFRKAVFEIVTEGQASLQIAQDLSYGSTDVEASYPEALTITGGGGYFESLTWDAFTFDAQIVATAEKGLDGTGINIGLLVYSNSDSDQPHTIQGVLLHYQLRRLQR